MAMHAGSVSSDPIQRFQLACVGALVPGCTECFLVKHCRDVVRNLLEQPLVQRFNFAVEVGFDFFKC